MVAARQARLRSQVELLHSQNEVAELRRMLSSSEAQLSLVGREVGEALLLTSKTLFKVVRTHAAGDELDHESFHRDAKLALDATLSSLELARTALDPSAANGDGVLIMQMDEASSQVSDGTSEVARKEVLSPPHHRPAPRRRPAGISGYSSFGSTSDGDDG